MPKLPAATMMPDRTAENGEGAAGCASGTQP